MINISKPRVDHPEEIGGPSVEEPGAKILPSLVQNWESSRAVAYPTLPNVLANYVRS